MQSTLSSAHDQWHRMYGKYSICDLDCGAGEIVGEIFEDDAEALREGAYGIRCGACKGRHASIAVVKFCCEVKRDAETFKRNEAAMEEAIATGGECEHGLRMALCTGPNHY